MQLNFSEKNIVLSTKESFRGKVYSYNLNFCLPKSIVVCGYKAHTLDRRLYASKVTVGLSKKKKNNLPLNIKFINLLMKNGNKLKANRIFNDSLRILYFKNLNSLLGSKKFTSIHLLQKKFNYSEYLPTNSLLKNSELFNREKSRKNHHSVSGKIRDTLVLTNANKLFIKAVENVKPSVETRNVKVSGITYPVPAVIGKQKRQILAIRWLIECATKNKKNTRMSFCECLASELYEASIFSGKAKQKRDAMHKHAEYNRAYIRWKWW